MSADKIRARQSYRRFKEYADWFKRKRSLKSILLKIHRIVDEHSGFHSQTQSCYAEESVNLLIKDLHNKQRRI